MAYRGLCTKFMRNLNLVKEVPSGTKIQPRMFIGSFQKPVENATKPKVSTFQKYYELIPLFVIVGGGIAGLMVYVIRNALTRDDVRFNPKAKMAYEIFDMEKDKAPKARKFVVYNQKYETPTGLIEAMEAIKEDNTDKTEDKKSK